MAKRLIGLTGIARSGKDTVAGILCQQHSFIQMAFANPLKDAAAVLFDMPRSSFDEGDREKPDPYWHLSPREILQFLGTDLIRNNLDPEFWIKRSYRQYLRTEESVVFSDVRFDDEADWIRSEGGGIIHINRYQAGLAGGMAKHASEAGIKHGDGDVYVFNNGTLKELEVTIKSALENLEVSVWQK